jgi:GTP-binding protein EngB required for normal cell division
VAKEIDDKVATVKKKAIVLVGLSRVGKSTSYNWILRHPLLAAKEGAKICYNPQSIRTDTAEVKSGFKSCTMVPNIVTLDKDTSLIDMPGFGDARDYVGTLAVSYSLKAIFEAVDEIRFVVVISESYLKDQDGLKLCKALSHFLQLFDFDALPSLKDNLFKATTLLVTQSKNPAEHLNFIESAIGNLEDP